MHNKDMTTLKKNINLLRCPKTNQSLKLIDNKLISSDKRNMYEIEKSRIPIFFEDKSFSNTSIQKDHYNTIYKTYVENLAYPHTIEYTNYLDKKFINLIKKEKFNVFLELCCGSGEGIKLFNKNYKYALGIDISINMLNEAYQSKSSSKVQFIQGDAINLPLKDSTIDCLVMLGGIHHIPNRNKLFKEVNRVLKSDGVFLWRDPVDDFVIWRLIRKIIYKISPALDEKTEEPLRFSVTKTQLSQNGLELQKWNTIGFFGFCLFMNSDVLLFNKVFRKIPKIRSIVKGFTKVDEFITNLSFMKNKGLIVIGMAKKKDQKEKSL